MSLDACVLAVSTAALVSLVFVLLFFLVEAFALTSSACISVFLAIEDLPVAKIKSFSSLCIPIEIARVTGKVVRERFDKILILDFFYYLDCKLYV